MLWQADAVLHVPTSALFRHGEGWAAFVVQDGKVWWCFVFVGVCFGLLVLFVSGLFVGVCVVFFLVLRTACG